MGATKAVTTAPSTTPHKKRPPSPTLEGRENEMIALAMDEAEYRIRNHTASAAEICHFLKLGTTIAQLEKSKLERENELLTAKADAIKSGQHSDEVAMKAIEAMKTYSGIKGGSDDAEELL